MVFLVLLVFALVCFVLSAINTPSRINLTAAGLAFVTAAMLFTKAGLF
jgi:hypothetical protein